MVHFKDPSCAASEVATYFLSLSQRDDINIDALKLQKLLYYAQAWSLASSDEPLFSDKIEAWPQGPVVATVYHEYKENGARSIDTTGVAQPIMTPDAEELIESVWSRYGRLSGIALSRMSHNEDPWLNARGDLDAAARSSREIVREDMRNYFADQQSSSEATLRSLLPGIIESAE